jgi:hypothetical protein
MSAFSSGTDDRGIIGGGSTDATTNQIEYVTISSAGNSTDFGDLTIAKKYGMDMGSNSD